MAAINKHISKRIFTIFYSLLGFLTLTAATQSSGKFSLLYAPKYVKFLESANQLNTEEIPSVILSTLGLPLAKDIQWNGLAEGNLFRRPKANVLISVLESKDSIDSFIPRASIRTYTTSKPDGFLDTDAVIDSIQLENWKQEPFFIDFSSNSLTPSIRSSSENLFTSLPSSYLALRDGSALSEFFTEARLGSLTLAQDADLELIGELETILGIVKNLESDPTAVSHQAPDFLHFHVSGLSAVQTAHGENSAQLNSARHLVQDVVSEITRRLRALYKDSLVVELVTVLPPSAEANLVRKTRSLLQAGQTDTTSNKTLNLAPAFTYMYAPIFNIVLWTMIAFGLAVFGVSWGMWNMDPGRDSLIYRMTSQRMKRD